MYGLVRGLPRSRAEWFRVERSKNGGRQGGEREKEVLRLLSACGRPCAGNSAAGLASGVSFGRLTAVFIWVGGLVCLSARLRDMVRLSAGRPGRPGRPGTTSGQREFLVESVRVASRAACMGGRSSTGWRGFENNYCPPPSDPPAPSREKLHAPKNEAPKEPTVYDSQETAPTVFEIPLTAGKQLPWTSGFRNRRQLPWS